MFRSDAGLVDERLEASYRKMRMVARLALSSKTQGSFRSRLVSSLGCNDLIHEAREARPRHSTSPPSYLLPICSVVRPSLGMMLDHAGAQMTKHLPGSDYGYMVAELLLHLILSLEMPVTNQNLLRVDFAPQVNISWCRVWYMAHILSCRQSLSCPNTAIHSLKRWCSSLSLIPGLYPPPVAAS